MKGSYILLIKLNNDRIIKYGIKKKKFFKKGFYIYAGSALNSLETRIERHLRSYNKKIFWHIDYLLIYCQILKIFYRENIYREECDIANFFYINGIEYEYEQDYEVETSTKKHRQYKPDFYLLKYELYIEHFALNKEMVPPNFIDKKQYLKNYEWKKKLHKKNGTKLIETFSYEKSESILLKNLSHKYQYESELEAYGEQVRLGGLTAKEAAELLVSGYRIPDLTVEKVIGDFRSSVFRIMN